MTGKKPITCDECGEAKYFWWPPIYQNERVCDRCTGEAFRRGQNDAKQMKHKSENPYRENTVTLRWCWCRGWDNYHGKDAEESEVDDD